MIDGWQTGSKGRSAHPDSLFPSLPIYPFMAVVKTLVVGLGNPILTDDGVGIYVARAAAERCQRDNVTFAEASVGGMRLLDVLKGYERVIMVDAIQTRDGKRTAKAAIKIAALQ